MYSFWRILIKLQLDINEFENMNSLPFAFKTNTIHWYKLIVGGNEKFKPRFRFDDATSTFRLRRRWFSPRIDFRTHPTSAPAYFRLI